MLGLVPQHLHPFFKFLQCFYFTQLALWDFARSAFTALAPVFTAIHTLHLSMLYNGHRFQPITFPCLVRQ